MGVKAGVDPKVMLDVINAGSGRNSATQDKFPRAVLPGTFDFGFATGLLLQGRAPVRRRGGGAGRADGAGLAGPPDAGGDPGEVRRQLRLHLDRQGDRGVGRRRDPPMTEGQILLESFLQALAAGALVGAIYGLMCVGLAMIFGIMRVINFAQGDFMMLGMYIAFYAFTLLGVQAAFGGIFGPYVAIAIAAPVLFAFGYLRAQGADLARHRLSHRRARGRGPLRPADPDARHRADPAERRHDPVRLDAGLDPHAAVQRAPGRSARSGAISSACSSTSRAPCPPLISVVVIVLLWLLITRSRLGKALRASADNPEASTYMGIDVDRAHRIAFALGTCITGDRRRAARHQLPVPAVRRPRIRDRHVRRRRARRHRQHHRRRSGAA